MHPLSPCRRPLASAAVIFFVFLFLAPSHAFACEEPAGALAVEARVLEVAPASARAETAIARVEVVVQTAVAAERIALELERPDGSPWPFHTPPPRWQRPGRGSDPSGDPEDAGGELSLPARSVARAILQVPLHGRAVHELVLKVTAETAQGALETEAFVMAPFGASLPAPSDDGAVAEFRAVPSKETP